MVGKLLSLDIPRVLALMPNLKQFLGESRRLDAKESLGDHVRDGMASPSGRLRLSKAQDRAHRPTHFPDLFLPPASRLHRPSNFSPVPRPLWQRRSQRRGSRHLFLCTPTCLSSQNGPTFEKSPSATSSDSLLSSSIIRPSRKRLLCSRSVHDSTSSCGDSTNVGLGHSNSGRSTRRSFSFNGSRGVSRSTSVCTPPFTQRLLRDSRSSLRSCLEGR